MSLKCIFHILKKKKQQQEKQYMYVTTNIQGLQTLFRIGEQQMQHLEKKKSTQKSVQPNNTKHTDSIFFFLKNNLAHIYLKICR